MHHKFKSSIFLNGWMLYIGEVTSRICLNAQILILKHNGIMLGYENWRRWTIYIYFLTTTCYTASVHFTVLLYSALFQMHGNTVQWGFIMQCSTNIIRVQWSTADTIIEDYGILHFTLLHFTKLHFTSLHLTSLHYTSLHFI